MENRNSPMALYQDIHGIFNIHLTKGNQLISFDLVVEEEFSPH
jgi:hypothetical protein